MCGGVGWGGLCCAAEVARGRGRLVTAAAHAPTSALRLCDTGNQPTHTRLPQHSTGSPTPNPTHPHHYHRTHTHKHTHTHHAHAQHRTPRLCAAPCSAPKPLRTSPPTPSRATTTESSSTGRPRLASPHSVLLPCFLSSDGLLPGWADAGLLRGPPPPVGPFREQLFCATTMTCCPHPNPPPPIPFPHLVLSSHPLTPCPCRHHPVPAPCRVIKGFMLQTGDPLGAPPALPCCRPPKQRSQHARAPCARHARRRRLMRLAMPACRCACRQRHGWRVDLGGRVPRRDQQVGGKHPSFFSSFLSSPCMHTCVAARRPPPPAPPPSPPSCPSPCPPRPRAPPSPAMRAPVPHFPPALRVLCCAAGTCATTGPSRCPWPMRGPTQTAARWDLPLHSSPPAAPPAALWPPTSALAHPLPCPYCACRPIHPPQRRSDPPPRAHRCRAAAAVPSPACRLPATLPPPCPAAAAVLHHNCAHPLAGRQAHRVWAGGQGHGRGGGDREGGGGVRGMGTCGAVPHPPRLRRPASPQSTHASLPRICFSCTCYHPAAGQCRGLFGSECFSCSLPSHLTDVAPRVRACTRAGQDAPQDGQAAGGCAHAEHRGQGQRGVSSCAQTGPSQGDPGADRLPLARAALAGACRRHGKEMCSAPR